MARFVHARFRMAAIVAAASIVLLAAAISGPAAGAGPTAGRAPNPPSFGSIVHVSKGAATFAPATDSGIRLRKD